MAAALTGLAWQRCTRWGLLIAAFAVLVAIDWRLEQPAARLVFGPTVGDVRATSALVWICTEGLDRVSCRVAPAGGAPAAAPTFCGAATVVPRQRPAGTTFEVVGLLPATLYEVVVPEFSPRALRRFRTMPASTAAAPLRVAFTADVGGQHIGRDERLGFAGFPVIAAQRPDVFLGLGDMIYADKSVPVRGRLGNRQIPLRNNLLLDHRDYWRHWKYLHEDPGFAALLAEASYVGIWDDHECLMDFGPGDSWGMLPVARNALFEWNPVLGPPEERQRLYRSLRWNKHCEVFVLDCRSYRDLAADLDTRAEPKTMLGKAQRDWLLAGLAASDATWQIIVSTVPLSAPTGSPRRGYGGWADKGSQTGYERELLAILRAVQQAGVRRPVFLVADVHYAEVIELTPFADDPGFRPLEIVVGPLNAGLGGRAADGLDPTLNPRSLYFLAPAAPADYEAARRLWNFGVIDVDRAGGLELTLRSVAGAVLFRLAVPPEPRLPAASSPR